MKLILSYGHGIPGVYIAYHIDNIIEGIGTLYLLDLKENTYRHTYADIPALVHERNGIALFEPYAPVV